MELLTALLVLLLQFASLSLEQIQDTVTVITTALTTQYVDDAAAGAKQKGPAIGIAGPPCSCVSPEP